MLEEPDTIDIISEAKDGTTYLVITDAGITADPDERYNCLIEKVRTYVGFIQSPAFEKQCPRSTRAKTSIRVMCATPPTEQMQAIQQVRTRTTPPLEISVEFVDFQ
jgi:hypothetical protein